MRANEKMLLAMSDIDETMIADAALEYNPFSRIIKRVTAIAASLIFCVTAAIIFANNSGFFGLVGGDMSGGASGGNMSGASGSVVGGDMTSSPDGADNTGDGATGEGTGKYTLYSAAGAIEFISRSEGKFSFRITLFDTTELNATIPLTDGDGTPVSASTAEESTLRPTITVDGRESDTLPSTMGSYTVVIDVSELLREGYSFGERISFYGFGEFNLTN